ncbi:hypothetical protein [Parasphingorhabdus sp.]|uniref:hypothetical protein n=1 Tax=Parasphingorhabdus sp. TaxID=2709688 RepID=UPI002F9588E3
MKQAVRTSRPVFAALAAMTLSAVLSGCQPDEAPVAPDPSPQDVFFFDRLSKLCGKAYSGQMVSDQAVDADMADRPMIVHVANCSQSEIQIPFHVGPSESEGADGAWDRSRTWIITRTEDGDKTGLRLKHRHRHEDGSLDSSTNYGGDTASQGTAGRQEFPVDDESIALFKAEGLDQSVTNIWAVEVSAPGTDDARFAYELRRPPVSETEEGRLFRVEFDLTQPVPAPPPPWGD